MYVLVPLLFLLLTNIAIAQTPATEPHLAEAGSSAIFMRSAFAHGYRHGYEDGYHVGNIDINMGRPPRTKLSQFRDLTPHYEPEFGPRKSFEAGFREGLRTGYDDGFVGRIFRAVQNLRLIANALDQNAASTDPSNLYFDQGFSTGYDQGLHYTGNALPAAERLDMHFISCVQFHPGSKQDIAAQGTFCDGYRRGFVLGHADAVTLGPEALSLAARK